MTQLFMYTGFSRVIGYRNEAPSFREIRHMKVVRLLALRTGHLPATVWPEGLCQRKIPMTPPVIEPSTFRFAAQRLNQLRPR